MTPTTLLGILGVVFFASGVAMAVIAPRYPSYEDFLQLAGGGFLIVRLCCLGIGLERVFGTALLH
jgi:aspartate/methionine/tyrosine aminotransferase